MHKRIAIGTRRPRLEQLETRNLLAGDVMVSVTDGGVLRIAGDDLANSVTIEAGENPGEYIITGRPTADGDTTVNGEPSFTAEGVRRGLRVHMGQGGDTVLAEGLTVRGGLGVAMGSGDDAVELNDVTVRRSLRVSLGEGTDTASLDGVAVGGRSAIRGGEGPNTVLIADSAFRRHLAVAGGPESDDITVSDSRVRALLIAARSGDNTITVNDTDVRRNVTILAGAGNDRITSNNTPPEPAAEGEEQQQPTHWGGARIVDRGGDNTIDIDDLVIGRGGLQVHTGGGVDNAKLENLRVRGRTVITTGGEADEVAILDSVFARAVRLHMGGADDILRIAESTFRRSAVFAGGDGVDTFFNEENEFLGPMFENFELPEAE